MIKRKNVIFYLNKQIQHSSSFHENSKIRYLKAYFRDITNISEFNFIINNKVILDEEITLKSLSSNKAEIIFYVEDNKLTQSEDIKSSDKLYNIELYNNDLENKNEILKDEISKIFLNSLKKIITF